MQAGKNTARHAESTANSIPMHDKDGAEIECSLNVDDMPMEANECYGTTAANLEDTETYYSTVAPDENYYSVPNDVIATDISMNTNECYGTAASDIIPMEVNEGYGKLGRGATSAATTDTVVYANSTKEGTASESVGGVREECKRLSSTEDEDDYI